VTPLSDAARAHVRQATRAWLGVTADEHVPDMPEELAHRLLRTEEIERAHRDQWGNWEFGFCDAFRAGALWAPDVDRWIADLRRERGRDAGWPEGRPFALCLTHDVDLVSESVTARQALRSMRLSLLGEPTSARDRALKFARPGVRAARALAHGISRAPAAEALERCLEIEHANGVTASYFFTAYPGAAGHRYDCAYDFGDPCRFAGERLEIGEVVARVDREGFEVGLHGSYNSAFTEGRLAREKAELERATGIAVRSTRQHFLHWDVRATPRIHAGAGFAADSTLGFNRNIGFRAGTSLPFRWFDVERDTATDLVQVPIAISDPALLRPDALELGLELGRLTLRTMLDRITAVGGAATLVFHPNNLARSDYLQLFEDAIAYGRERDAWFATVADLDAWIRSREPGGA
jgi:hypothetical protein